ncbi:MAG: glycosyltransferase family 4 protein [Blastocatellia bacterium]
MKVTFVLPMYLDNPSGGFKVVYEYASRLQDRGHQVSVVHPRSIELRNEVKDKVKSRLWSFRLRLKHRPLIPWINIHPEVRLVLVPDLREEFIPDGDVIFATAYETAFWVNGYGGRKGRGFYLIQSYENWSGPEERVRQSWLLPLRKVVISQWLMNIARSYGEEDRADYIPIGLDFSRFRITTPIDQRNTPRVGMLAHLNENKGMKDGITALEMVRAELPGIQAVLFGAHPRNTDIPEWIEYAHRPPLEKLVDIYNSCQVFLNPSWMEGWGLTAAEAMACGCALVSTANGGVNEFAANGESALLAPIKAPEELARQLLRALQSEELRRRLARKGSEQIGQFTWDRAVSSLERLLVGSGDKSFEAGR